MREQRYNFFVLVQAGIFRKTKDIDLGAPAPYVRAAAGGRMPARLAFGNPPARFRAPRRRQVAVFGTTERPRRPPFLTRCSKHKMSDKLKIKLGVKVFLLAATPGAVGLSAQMRGRPALVLRAWRVWLPAGRPAATAGLRRITASIPGADLVMSFEFLVLS